MLGRIRHFLSETHGAIAPLVALGLVVFIGVGGLAWDVSRAYALRGELDSAIDAAALAGATQLDGNTGARTRATAAAKGALAKNPEFLARTAEGTNVAIADADITYLQNLTSRTAATSDANANFIQINLANNKRSFGVVTGAVIRTFNFDVSSHAVAGYGSAICKVPPLFVCNPDETQSIDLFAAHAGKGIIMNGKGGSSAFAPGNFGFLSVGNGVGPLQQALGRSPPLTECFGETVETRTGDPTAVLDYFNTRFDIYDGTQVEALKTSAYFAPAEITITGLDKISGGSDSMCSPGRTGAEYDGSNGGSITAMAMPRDTCAYASGGSTCTGGANALGNAIWDRVNYFRINHGVTSTISTSTAPITGETWASLYDYPGVSPKPTYPTRYQTYLWEKANKSNALIWPTGNRGAAANSSPAGPGDFALRQCGTQNAVAGVPDRRAITVLVLNCSTIQNNKPQSVIGAVDVFLTEPARTDGNGMIIGEIISSSSDTSAVGKETRLYSVRLYE